MNLRYSTKNNDTQETHYEKALHLFLKHFSCLQLVMQNKNKTPTSKQTPHTKKPHSKLNTYSMTIQVMAQSLMTYFNHRQTILHKDVFMIFKLESNYVAWYVCTYHTYLYLYNPYLIKFFIYWNTVLILFHAYLNLVALLAYHSHWTTCTLVCHLPALQWRHTNHSCSSFPNTLQKFPLKCPVQSNYLTIY